MRPPSSSSPSHRPPAQSLLTLSSRRSECCFFSFSFSSKRDLHASLKHLQAAFRLYEQLFGTQSNKQRSGMKATIGRPTGQRAGRVRALLPGTADICSLPSPLLSCCSVLSTRAKLNQRTLDRTGRKGWTSKSTTTEQRPTSRATTRSSA